MKELKPSAKMKRAIKMIEELTDIKFTGKSYNEAQKFLEENLPKIKDKDIRDVREPSDKMWRGISFIQSMLHIEFHGSTMKEASDFIGQHMQAAKEEANRRKKS